MNTLEFEKFGVQGLDTKEMVDESGGFIFAVIGAVLVGGFIYETLNNYDAMVKAAEEGYNDGKEAIKRK